VENGVGYFPDSEVLISRLIADEGYFCGLIGKLHLSASQAAVERRPREDGYRTFAWAHHPYPDVEEADYVRWLRQEKGVDPKALYDKLTGRRDPDRHKDRAFSEYNDCLPSAALYADGRETDQTHSTMHLDGRFKVSIHYGLNLGEIYDLESDPGEFNDLWDEPDFQRKKVGLLIDHMEAMASTISPGIRRIKDY